MCSIIVINRGEKEIESIDDFMNHFDCEKLPWLEKISDKKDTCLCAIDVRNYLESQDCSFKTHFGDYYIGQLSEIKEFDMHYRSLKNSK